jgi:hypothetical protein
MSIEEDMMGSLKGYTVFELVRTVLQVIPLKDDVLIFQHNGHHGKKDKL